MLCSSKITNSSVNAAYVDIVTDEVKKRTGLDPLKTQMNIYTYCNSETQALAAAIGNGEKYDYSDEDMRMGGAVQSSQDGRIVAVIGGRNYNLVIIIMLHKNNNLVHLLNRSWIMDLLLKILIGLQDIQLMMMITIMVNLKTGIVSSMA